MCVITHSCVCAMTHVWEISLSCVWWCWRGVSILVPCLPYVCAMTHPYVCYDSFICVPWLNNRCWGVSIFVPCLPCVCAITHVRVSCSSFMRVLWLIRKCGMAYFFETYGGVDDAELLLRGPWRIHMCVPWPIYVCAMTHSHLCHDPFISVPCPNSLDHA